MRSAKQARFTRSLMVAVAVAVYAMGVIVNGCARKDAEADARTYATTIHPLRMILQELVQGRAEVVAIIPPGASPHTYEPRPSDLRAVDRSLCFFRVSPLLDGWAAELPARESVEVIGLLPPKARRFFPEGVEDEHHAEGDGPVVDPHFWTDPATVAQLLPPLTEKLCALDPEGAETYRANAKLFGGKLRLLDEEFAKTLQPVKGKSVFLFHPSFLYLLGRYGIVYQGSIEAAPGKEASPAYLIAMIKTIREKRIPVIFTEPQLPRRPAEMIAEETHAKLAELDPNGGVMGRMTYAELIRYNVTTFRNGLIP